MVTRGRYHRSVVLDDPSAAAEAVAAGADVVLILPPGWTGPPETVEIASRGPGRLAPMVGEPGDPVVRRAAAEMEAELFPAAGVTSRR